MIKNIFATLRFSWFKEEIFKKPEALFSTVSQGNSLASNNRPKRIHVVG